jgi:hypothetical protein
VRGQHVQVLTRDPPTTQHRHPQTRHAGRPTP